MPRITQNQMAKMFQRFATSYTAGIDLRTILQKETEIGSASQRMKSIEVADGVDDGKTIAEAMRGTEGYYPELAISVVHAGERGGRLDDSFHRLAKHYHNLVAFRTQLLASLAWPIFELGFAITIVGAFMAICDWIFTSMEMEKYNWFGMGSTAGNVAAYFVLVLFMLVGIYFLVLGSARGWFGTLPIRIARKIPLIGPTIEAMSLSRFAWTMSVAENAGMNPVETAQLALRSTENYYYKQLEGEVCDALQSGGAFYPVLKSTDAFPQDLLIYIENGETAGQLAESMDRASQEYQTKADVNLKMLGVVGFVATMLFVAIVVLVIVVFAFQQYINVLNSLMTLGIF